MTKLSRRLWPQHLFRDKGILPTRRLIGIFSFLMIPIFLASFWDMGWGAFIIINSTLMVVSLIDLWILPRRNQLTCTRLLKEEVERGQDFDVRLLITNQSRFPIRFRLIDSLPISFARPFPLEGEISPTEKKEISYSTKATVKGDYELDIVYFRYTSELGLWEKQMVFPIHNTVRVIPDMSQAREHLAALQQFLYHEGMRVRKRRVGEGEFAQIRTYVTGDDPRKINWRQTGKLAELMTNVYEPEHGKHITLLIDCGRTMGIELKKGNRIERSVEAAITVAASALQQGDYVSVVVFSNEVKAYIPAGKGMAHLQTILRGIYNIHSDPLESNYSRAFDYLEAVQKRRSFILLFSDLDPLLFEESALFYINRLRRKHLFVLLGIADPMITYWANKKPVDTRLALIKSMAQKQVLDRKQEMKRWNRLGIEMLEVPEEQLATRAVTYYIEVINRGLL